MTKPMIRLHLEGVLTAAVGWQSPLGPPLSGAAEFTKQLARMVRIIICTTRPAGSVVHWLDRHTITYDEIVSDRDPSRSPLISAQAITCRPQESHTPEFEYQFALAAAATLCDKMRKKNVSPVFASGSLN